MDKARLEEQVDQAMKKLRGSRNLESIAAVFVETAFTREEMDNNAQTAARIYSKIMDIFAQEEVNPAVGTTIALMVDFTACELEKEDRRSIPLPASIPSHESMDVLMRDVLKTLASKIGTLAFKILRNEK